MKAQGSLFVGHTYCYRKFVVKRIRMTRTVKTLAQLAFEYNVHISTMRRWIVPIKEKLKLNPKRRLLLPWQIELIYEFLDKPE